MAIIVGIVKVNQIVKSGDRFNLLALKITVIKVDTRITMSVSGEINDKRPSILITSDFINLMGEFFVKTDYDTS